MRVEYINPFVETSYKVLKEVLGHENLGTTEIYTHVSNSQIQDASHRSPLSKVKPKIAPVTPTVTNSGDED